jgi:hypothetical protein
MESWAAGGVIEFVDQTEYRNSSHQVKQKIQFRQRPAVLVTIEKKRRSASTWTQFDVKSLENLGCRSDLSR